MYGLRKEVDTIILALAYGTLSDDEDSIFKFITNKFDYLTVEARLEIFNYIKEIGGINENIQI